MEVLPQITKIRVFFHHGYPRKVIGMKTPQQLSRQAIDEFKAIYQEEFGIVLSDDEVQEIAVRLLRFFGILSKSLSDENRE